MCSAGSIKRWVADTGQELREFRGYTNWVSTVAFSPGGRFALSGSDDRTPKLWDVSEWTQAR
ncbi:MAG: WD40 repeat domain-containing protein [Rhodomicrobium sp.]